ncbi:MAG: LuxR C-terminal-related transcriptional regulator [Pseudonocardia sp.]
MRPTEDPLEAGQAALDRGDWAGAQTIFAGLVDQRETAEALHGLARALEWGGDYQGAIDLYERAFRAFRAEGQSAAPAVIAGRELSFLYLAVHGNLAAAGGWLARARRLVGAAGDCVERGWVALADALMEEDPDRREQHVELASTIAARFDDPDLQFCALGYEGLCLVLRGRVTEGMGRVDEAAAAATVGEVRDYITAGEIYCKMLVCCELTLDVRRARQWMAVVEKFARQKHAPWVSAICRMHYGGVLIVAGRWPQADRELSESLRLYAGSYRALRSGALVRLAELRARQGRFEEAARLLESSPQSAEVMLPLARVHLARGEADVAAALLARALPDRDSGERVLRAPALALHAEAELAAGRHEHARALGAELLDLAKVSHLTHVYGYARYVAGLVADPTGEPVSAHLEAALASFTEAELPLEEARARMALARELTSTRPALAIAEARTALATCARLGAQLDADAAAGLLRGLGVTSGAGPRGEGALTRRESEVLRLVGEGLSNQRIAERLFLSKRTVEHHVGAVLAKLGLTTRSEALAYAIRNGPAEGV